MLTAPADLDEGALAAVLGRAWGIGVVSLAYRPVGWGSHHWDVAEAGGARWFVTVDELENKRLTGSESLDRGFERLRASLWSAVELRHAGRDFVVAPVPAADGEPAVRLSERFAVAVYPFVDGQSFRWGEGDTHEWRLGMVAMMAAVHSAPAGAHRRGFADSFAVPFRDELEAACSGDMVDCGPYARPVADLLREHAAAMSGVLRRYDELVATAKEQSGRTVLTHGEPHPGNTMLSADGNWLLIDWDTALVAPPERDLWTLDPGDGSILDAYTAATGVVPLARTLALYRLGWDIKDIAYDTSRFRRPHAGTPEDDKTWEILSSLVQRVTQ